MSLGERIVAWRRLEGIRLGLGKDLPQPEAARRLGCSRALLSATENGKHVPQSRRILAALHREVGIHPAEWWSAA